MSDAEYYLKSGYAHYEKGELDLAIADFTKAIELNPNLAEAMAVLAFVYKEKGDKENAKLWAKRALEKRAYLSEEMVEGLKELLDSLE